MATATANVVTPTGLTMTQVFNRLRKYAEAEARQKTATAEMKAIKAEIVGDSEGVECDDKRFRVKYIVYTKQDFDTKRFAAEHPDLYEQYRKQTRSTKFTYVIR